MKVSSRAETFQDVSLPIPGKNDIYLELTKCTLVKSLLSATSYDNHLSLVHICVTELKTAQKVVLYINLF